jgi:hypothetical protein
MTKKLIYQPSKPVKKEHVKEYVEEIHMGEKIRDQGPGVGYKFSSGSWDLEKSENRTEKICRIHSTGIWLEIGNIKQPEDHTNGIQEDKNGNIYPDNLKKTIIWLTKRIPELFKYSSSPCHYVPLLLKQINN